MTDNVILGRIRKLMNLSKSDNVNEAATAAERARELMTQYKIEAADLELTTGEKREYEAVTDTTLEGNYQRGRHKRWRLDLAVRLSNAFGCKMYYTPGTTHMGVVGQPSSIQTVQYLLQYFGLEMTRLCKQEWETTKAAVEREGGVMPRPSIWKNSFMDGAVHAIGQKLDEQRARERKAMTEVAVDHKVTSYEAPDSEAMAAIKADPQRLAGALVLMREEEERHKKDMSEAWQKRFGKRGGRSGSWGPSKRDYDGYSAGKRAGGSINMSNARGSIGGAKPRITS